MSLVQRLERKTDPNGKGVDRYFSMNYMGSSEFEWGILKASLNVMRKQSNLLETMDIGGQSMFYFGPTANFDGARALVFDQLGACTTHLKEATMMKASMDGEDYAKRTIGWWWLSQDGWPQKERATLPTWCIFKTLDDAMNWQKGIENP